MFDCIRVRDLYLMRQDPRLECYTAEWRAWAVVAVMSILLYCVGIPFFLYLIARQYTLFGGNLERARWWRIRASLLLASYRSQFWWFESCASAQQVSNSSNTRQRSCQTCVSIVCAQLTSCASCFFHLWCSLYGLGSACSSCSGASLQQPLCWSQSNISHTLRRYAKRRKR